MDDTSSQTPHNFQIRCTRCRWSRTTSGTKDDLTDLHEVKNTCSTCGKIRKFACPKCGGKTAKMFRISGNAPAPTPPSDTKEE